MPLMAAMLMAVTRVVLGPTPLLMLLNRELRLSQEIPADAAAAEGDDRAAYATGLLMLAKTQTGGSVALATGAWRSRGELLRRMQVLLGDQRRFAQRCGRGFALTASLVVLAAAGVLMTVTLTGTTKFTNVNKLTIEAEVDKGELGIAAVKYFGGTPTGIQAVKFPSPKGGEEQKGTDDMKRARLMLKAEPSIDFIGYIEGRAVFNGDADVVITDGVVGNVMIKLAEGLSEGIFKAIAREIKQEDPELAQRFAPIVKRIYARHDYHEYGGAPLLGVNGVCIITHGSSVARTMTAAILRSKMFV